MDFVKQNDPAGGDRAGARGGRRQYRRDASATSAAAMRPKKTRLFALRTVECRPQPAARLHRHHRGLRPRDRAGRHFDLPGAALGAARATRPKPGCATTISISKPPSTSAPPTCAKPTTKSSASPISSATICARRWSTSWASPASSRNCATTSSGGSRPLRQRRGPTPSLPATCTPTPSRRWRAPTSSSRQDFSEALGFIKSSIAKMDRLITAILNLTREGRREFEPVRDRYARADRSHRHDRGASGRGGRGPDPHRAAADIVSDRLALEQIFSNLIDNALKYLKPGVPGDIAVRGRTKLGFAIFEICRQRPRHRPQGPSAHFRPVPPRRNPGQAGPGHRPCPCPRPGAAARRNHVGLIGTQPRQHLHDHAAHQLDSQ